MNRPIAHNDASEATTTLSNSLKGRSIALSMSSGFFGFFHHAGVLNALTTRGIHPMAVAGTSAGAIVASLFASGLSPTDICEGLLSVRRTDFWDIQFPFTRTGFGWLRGERFAHLLRTLLRVTTFEECPIPVSVGVYTVSDGRSRQLNSGNLVDAVRASCAVPYLFPPVDIDADRYLDGGLQEKTPLVHWLENDHIDTVIISHLPPREHRHQAPPQGQRGKRLPLFMDTPYIERMERDRAAVRLLKDAGKRVLVLAPPRIWLGPFSLNKASHAMDHAFDQTLALLDSGPPYPVGCTELPG